MKTPDSLSKEQAGPASRLLQSQFVHGSQLALLSRRSGWFRKRFASVCRQRLTAAAAKIKLEFKKRLSIRTTGRGCLTSGGPASRLLVPSWRVPAAIEKSVHKREPRRGGPTGLWASADVDPTCGRWGRTRLEPPSSARGQEAYRDGTCRVGRRHGQLETQHRARSGLRQRRRRRSRGPPEGEPRGDVRSLRT